MEYAQDRPRPQHDHGAAVWAFLNRVLFAAVLVVATYGIVIYFTPAREKTAKMNETLEKKQTELHSLQLQNMRFTRDLTLLRENNTEFLETIARDRVIIDRDRVGGMKPKETILLGVDIPAPPAPATPPATK